MPLSSSMSRSMRFVFAIVSENLTESQAQAAIKKLKDYFVDWNDLRVATVDEIAEVLGPDVEPARASPPHLSACLTLYSTNTIC